ncbi:MAG: oxygenase MpaB family protein [Myxococcota bacterium]|nr:oxygenase MpaB family protein [Myxococcota bacterium]
MNARPLHGVTASEMETHLAALFNDGDATVGLFGPESMLWTIGRESVVVLGGGRAALLQLAHPFIAHAVKEHSSLLDDIRGRFQRTLSSMFTMTFGDRAEAIRLARHIYELHRTIRGTLPDSEGDYRAGQPYSALNRKAMFWVAATLWDTSIAVYEQIIGPLSAADKDAYYSETKVFCRLFGLSSADMPADWRQFRTYVDDICASSALHVGPVARQLAQDIFMPPNPVIAPLYAWIRLMTAATLAPPLRQAYGLTYGPRERIAYQAGLVALRRVVPRLPDSIRYCPEYIDARRRLAGEPGLDRFSEAWRRTVLKLLGPLV